MANAGGLAGGREKKVWYLESISGQVSRLGKPGKRQAVGVLEGAAEKEEQPLKEEGEGCGKTVGLKAL